MDKLINILLVPLGLIVVSLLLEYWIIQPIREEAKKRKSEIIYDTRENFTISNSINRLLASLPTITPNKASSILLKNVGSCLGYLPIGFIKLFVKALYFLISLLFTLICIPYFVMLFYSEKLATCHFEPTCKEYLVTAVERYGPIKGLLISLDRVSRCSPFGEVGFDPVPEEFAIRNKKRVVKKVKKKSFFYYIFILLPEFIMLTLLALFLSLYTSFLFINLVLSKKEEIEILSILKFFVQNKVILFLVIFIFFIIVSLFFLGLTLFIQRYMYKKSKFTFILYYILRIFAIIWLYYQIIGLIKFKGRYNESCVN